MEDRPKSAFEIAMARLEKQDREEGVVATALTEEQKARIAEARSLCAARLAEREILHRDALARTGDPAAREQLEQEFATDRRRLEEDRDREIERLRKKP